MATEKKDMSGLISPANLWGKPLPRALSRPTTVENSMSAESTHAADDQDDDAEEVVETPRRRSVRAELPDLAGPTDEELHNEESTEDEEEDDDFDEEAGDEIESDAVNDSDETAEETENGFAYAESDSDDATANLDDDDESKSKNIGAAVDPEDEADSVASPVTHTKRGPAMADTKKKSISDHVREEIDRRRKSGDSLRGVDIVTALAARKIVVSPAQVSQLLKKAGIAPKARGPRKAKEAAGAEERSRSANKATPKTAPKPAASPSRPAPARGPLLSDESFSLQLPVAQLQAAEKFVAACGSLKKAERILTLAAQLAGRTAG